MANPDPNSSAPSTDLSSTLPGVWQCLGGSVVSGAIAVGFYRLTLAIAQYFVARAPHTDNITILNISVALRTFIVGLSALGTGIFGLVSLGLLGLGMQVLLRGRSQTPIAPDPSAGKSSEN
jgi:hypothetical protein